jgi:isopentenyl diphosphate isomerase/L-lactate dehydrogenase-like FMN-dependent dehydrogenase
MRLLERAHDSGYKALCVSVDVPAPGKRERDIANKVYIPPQVTWNKIMNILIRPFWLKEYLLGPQLTRGNMVGLASFYGMSRKQILASIKDTGPANPSLTWDDLAWMRKIWKGPMVIKGILNADDARRAIDYGINGIIVSNHGGRQLDGQPATIEVLPEIIASVDDRAEVFIDSGIRRGTDVVKAIAMGARACFVGRPYLFSLAIGGEEGVLRMLEVLKDEIDRTLALLGCRSLSDLNSEYVGSLAC